MSQFTVGHALAHAHYGRALKLLLKQLDDKPTKELEKKCVAVSADLLPSPRIFKFIFNTPLFDYGEEI